MFCQHYSIKIFSVFETAESGCRIQLSTHATKRVHELMEQCVVGPHVILRIGVRLRRHGLESIRIVPDIYAGALAENRADASRGNVKSVLVRRAMQNKAKGRIATLCRELLISRIRIPPTGLLSIVLKTDCVLTSNARACADELLS
jgi:hypothetical protein